jgi:lipopolysaccharide transport system ATP-binding protein
VAKEGRTVLFVSHNMPMILRLCQRTVLLSRGQIIADGNASEITRIYLSMGRESPSEKVWSDPDSAPGDDIVRLKSVRLCNRDDGVSESIAIDEPCTIEIEYWNMKQHGIKPTAIIHLYNEDGTCLFATNDWNNKEWWNKERKPGLVKARCHIPANFLAEGRFFVLAAIGTYNPNVVHAHIRDVISFQVIDRSIGDGSRGSYSGGQWPGVLRPYLKWDVSDE